MRERLLNNGSAVMLSLRRARTAIIAIAGPAVVATAMALVALSVAPALCRALLGADLKPR